MEKFEKDKAKLAEADTVSYSSSDSVSNYLFDSRRGELLGRSFSSWLKLLLFYGLFCSLLALLWGLCIGVFFQTLDFYIPKYIQNEGLLGTNPGLGFRPTGGLGFSNDKGEDSAASPYSSLIWFRHGAGGNWQTLKQNLDKFLEQYEPGFFANQGASLTKCDFHTDPLNSKNPNERNRAKDKSCEFNKEWLSDQNSDYKCITQEDYGYRHGKPCILLKMNKIYDWRPVPYTYDQIVHHPTMPRQLKTDIKKIWEDDCAGYNASSFTRPCPEMNMVWLHCDGEDDPDRENIGLVTYIPFRGFPGYFYPYRNQRGYLSPIVMVQLKNPVPGVLMNIECTAWAANIQHSRLKRRGLTHFELIMD